DLAKAEPRFNFDNRSWVLLSSESVSHECINSVCRHRVRLANLPQKGACDHAVDGPVLRAPELQ
ncbi:hypothetical protein B1218_37475, partial [Pseudomonas ogarae]